MKRQVLTYSLGTEQRTSYFERIKNAAIARWIADLKDCEFAGEYDVTQDYTTPPYLVPHRTIVGLELANQAGIKTPDDLYGGVVPRGFLATKAISHGLVGPKATRPGGWSDAFSEAIKNAVLPGYTAFSVRDADHAGKALLEGGSIRTKATLSAGWEGQSVTHTAAELASILAMLDPDELSRVGFVLERNLDKVKTYSFGKIQAHGITASYYGVQTETYNNQAEACYGGSDLVIARGGHDRLLNLDIPEHIRLAVSQAAVFDQATQHYPQIIVSRRNYDIGQGFDSNGKFISGVFEQSWTIGGASGPEVAALQAFSDDPALQVVEASSVERYGESIELPSGARVLFCGVDPEKGSMKMYTIVTASYR